MLSVFVFVFVFHVHFSDGISFVINFNHILNVFRSHNNSSHGGKGNSGSSYNSFDQQQDFNTYGLSPSFLASLNIIGPLHTKVFVANVSMNLNVQRCFFVFFKTMRFCSISVVRSVSSLQFITNNIWAQFCTNQFANLCFFFYILISFSFLLFNRFSPNFDHSTHINGPVLCFQGKIS